MLPFEDRYTRQRQLADVGGSGQTRLQQSSFQLDERDDLPPLARVVAADYLQRAGVRIELGASQLGTQTQGKRPPPLTHFQFDGPTQVALGALTALAHIRSVLEIGSA
jgi:hypothetical protein